MSIRHRFFLTFFLLLAFGLVYSAQAQTTVQRPDQYFTLGVYRCAAVDRIATAEIMQFERSANGVAWTTSTGIVSGDIVGTATLDLVEYDSAADTVYKSKIHVTVIPHDKSIDVKLDPAANSLAVKNHVQHAGYQFPVGMQFSVKMIYTQNGVQLPVSYTSNRPSVATVDQNGTVTMRSAGTVAITVSCENAAESQTMPIIVYDENSGGSVYAHYDPQDKAQKLNVYKSADINSPVVATIKDDEPFFVFSKNTSWSRVSINGVVGYVQSGSLNFADNPNWPVWPTLEAGAAADIDAVDKAVHDAGWPLSGTPAPDTATEKTMVIQTGNSGKLHLRKAPSSSASSLGLYENGTQVIVHQISGEWAQASVMGKAGYMMAKFLAADDANAPEVSQEPAPSASPGTSATPAPDAFAAGSTLYVQTGNEGKLNLRAKASSSAATVDRYANGTQVAVLSVSGAWVRVRVNNRTGYMMQQYLSSDAPAAATATPAPSETPAPQDEGTATPAPSATPAPDEPSNSSTLYVNTDNGGKLNLRAKASSSAATVDRYAVGTQVTVIRVSGDWVYVRVNGRTGYMMKRHLSAQAPQAASSPDDAAPPSDQAAPEPAGGTMYVRTENDEKLHLRAKPSKSSASLDRYPNGTQVTILSLSGEWAKVRVNGRTGYMMHSFLREK